MVRLEGDMRSIIEIGLTGAPFKRTLHYYIQ